MGDIVEVTTSDQLGLATYELSTSSLLFYLKTSEHGVIFLSETSNGYEYKININIDGYTWFESADNFDELNRKHTPDLLSQDEYKKFWMAWYIPPKTTNHHLETSIDYPIFDSGKPMWKEASHQLPINAVIGGYENEILYIIRSELRGSLTPGKFVPSLGIGFMPWGGTCHETANFSITDSDVVCEGCWELAMGAVNQVLQEEINPQGGQQASSSNRGHSQVCILCGCSILRRQSDLIFRENPSQLQIQVVSIIEGRISPRQVSHNDLRK
ncbi:unnamed protein product [Leptidea sinapis]|uniref:Uncharacterized protein n=1 Tax=Leptidea sinapis TaxID=189913 RepID=A0A5E4PR79_9NEOP|nr:unnamed protein product [Leptidea sinapis]